MNMTTESVPPIYQPTRLLRRSRENRVLTGVSGGLAEYFAVDPVLFRVLFAVLSVFGGVGLFMYLLCWLLIAESGSDTSALDRGIGQLRLRRIPPWVVVIGGAFVLWIGWFAWWAPGETFGPLALIAVVLLVLIYRTRAFAPKETDAKAGFVAPGDGSATDVPLGRLAPPLAPSTFTPMQEWLAEARAAKKVRSARRRPLRIAIFTALLGTWTVLGITDSITRVSFVVYLWSTLAILGLGFVTSVIARRGLWLLPVPIAVVLLGLLAFGPNRNSLGDGMGEVTWAPNALASTQSYHQFAGRSMLDLSAVPAPAGAATVQVHQAAGEITVRVPRSLNARIVAHVHLGDIQRGTTRIDGRFVAGVDVDLTIPASTTDPAGPTIDLDLTNGHIQIEEV
jgi:phage shock protein PspC (stress-responsive transcriptional regulator)